MSVERQLLEAQVKRAARAANRRLRELERAGEISPAYRLSRRDLGERRRYWERIPKSASTFALQRELAIASDFLRAKTSTLKGLRAGRKERYEKAVQAGYKGTQEQFEFDLQVAFTKEIENLFSSDVIYESVVEGNIDLVEKIAKQSAKKSGKNQSASKAFRRYLKERKKREEKRGLKRNNKGK